MSDNKKIGRPKITAEQKENILRKVGPYLRAGLSVNKACTESGVPKSTVFDLIKSDLIFSDKINQFRQFLSVFVSNAMLRQLNFIIDKQEKIRKKKAKGKKITKDDTLTNVETSFLQWFAIHSKSTKDEFGERKDIGLYDPEAEIKRLAGIIDEVAE